MCDSPIRRQNSQESAEEHKQFHRIYTNRKVHELSLKKVWPARRPATYGIRIGQPVYNYTTAYLFFY